MTTNKPLRIEFRQGTPAYNALIELSMKPEYKGKALTYVASLAISSFLSKHNGDTHHDKKQSTSS